MKEQMELHRMENRSRDGYAVWGGAWKKGSVPADAAFRLKDEMGTEIPVQSSVRAWWPDGSVKWSAHTADAVRLGQRAVLEAVELPEAADGAGEEPGDREAGKAQPESESEPGAEKEPEPRVKLEKGQEAIRISTGRAQLTVPLCGSMVFEDYRIDGRLTAKKAEPVLLLEEREEKETAEGTVQIRRRDPADKGGGGRAPALCDPAFRNLQPYCRRNGRGGGKDPLHPPADALGGKPGDRRDPHLPV